MTDKLTVYNLALVHLRERRLSSLTEAREPRRVLDDLWDQVQQLCLEEGLWNFMQRTVQIDASTTVIPAFGYKNAFTKPNDWLRTTLVSTVETFTPPLLDYSDETKYLFANWTPLFVQYQSNDPLYGTDLGSWSAAFTAYVALQLAEYGCGKITGSEKMLDGPTGISKRLRNARIKAKANDAMNEPPGQIPTGTWVRARRGFLRGIPLPGGTQFDD